MKRKRDAYAALFQTQLLKVVLTTLYVDIKEPAPNFFGVTRAYFSPQKNPIWSPAIIHAAVHHAGTKLSSNLQSQIMREPPRQVSGPASGGLKK